MTGDPHPQRRRRTGVRRRLEREAFAATLCVAMCAIGAAPVVAAEPTALCIPILMQCSPQLTPAPTPTIRGPLDPGPVIPGPVTPPSPPDAAKPAPASPDEEAPVFTLPAAQLGGSSISITGLRSVTVVTVPLANGTRARAIKLVADDVVVTDFLLDVRKATGPSLVTTADRMELRGTVQVYLDSLTATLPDGTPLTFGAATPPPGDELPATLLRVNLGLVGVTADSIAFAAPHQDLKE